MSLKDDIEAAVESQCNDGYVTEPIVEAVWAVLEDKIGTAQEALFTQLTMARAELDASRRREAELRATLSALQTQMVAAHDEEL